MRVARVLAQAKINVYLHVYERDASGYHEIATLFQRIDLADEIVVRVGGKNRSLHCSGPRMPREGLGPPEKNLAFRAAEEYAARVDKNWASGFSIEITKNIPVGGGLGGGSADAGAVLRVLQALAPRAMDAGEMHLLASSLGSDVPFLSSDSAAAIGLGRGDLVQPLPEYMLPDVSEVLLLIPKFSISTTEAYRWLDEDRRGREKPPSPSPSQLVTLEVASSRWNVFAKGHLSGNDFEHVVERKHPELRHMRETLASHGAKIARLSGSGSTVFGVFEGRVPTPEDLALSADVIRTRTSSRVVQVEVLE